VTVGEAVAEGKHMACCAPLGYRRADEVEPGYDRKGKLIRDARLLVEPFEAKIVAGAYEGVGRVNRRVSWPHG
jgi:hypothetical protein